MTDELDLGDGIVLRFYAFTPDREVNPQYDDLPDLQRVGAILSHPLPAGGRCEGSVPFDNPVNRRVNPGAPLWRVLQEDPLTLDPSLNCHCGQFHGHIVDGKWRATDDRPTNVADGGTERAGGVPADDPDHSGHDH